MALIALDPAEELRFYRSIDDPRGFLDEFPDPRQWRSHLREKVYRDRKGVSDLTQMPIRYSFDLHESIFSRRWVGKQDWQWFLFCGINTLVLTREEHANVPSREIAYWLAVARYSKEKVGLWIDSLPFKSSISRPWVGTNGALVLAAIPDSYTVHANWYKWFDSICSKVDTEA